MDSNLARAVERFVQDAGDARAFETLEEHHFLHGQWSDLVKLYERRMEAGDVAASAQSRAHLCFRLGQVHEERCLEIDRALEYYQEAARLAPAYRAPLLQMRRIYAAREAWDLVLQVAELEAELPMEPRERAAFCAQMGEIWHSRMDDAGQGRSYFERALEADPDRLDALLGLARIKEAEGDAAGAVEALERVVERTAGPDAARPLVALARLQRSALGDPARAEELYRRALGADPRSEDALLALCELAGEAEKWPLVVELLERRFQLAAGAAQRLAIAHEAGRLALEELRDVAAARLWLGRALELFADDPVTLLLLADAEGLAGDDAARAGYLHRAAEAAPDAVPLDVAVESAVLRADAGDVEAGAHTLEGLLERDPDHVGALGALARLRERMESFDAAAALHIRRAEALGGCDREAAAAAWSRAGELQERRLDDASAARASLARALEARPGLGEAEDALVRLHLAAEAWDDARQVLAGAGEVARGRRRVLLHVQLGDLILEHQGDVEAALAAFQAALDVDASEPRALQGLERIALLSGDEDLILESFEREAAVTTDRARLSFLVWELVKLYERRDQPDEALLWIERLVSVAPEDRQVLETCARLQEELGLGDELIETLECLDALLAGAEQAANRRRMGELLIKEGDGARAIATYRSALEADPEDTAALRALLGPLEREGRHVELADVHNELAGLLHGEERARSLEARVGLLENELDDAAGAIAALEELAGEPAAPPGTEERLAAALERSGRFEDLVGRLAARREACGPDAREALGLDLRRATVLLEQLARPTEAAPLFAALEEQAGLGDDERARVRAGLEQSLRRAGDAAGLADFLGRRAEGCDDASLAAGLRMEQAGLLVELGRGEAARALYQTLADAGDALAETRLRDLLEQTGAYDALCRRLEAGLDALEGEARADALERVAALRRDHLSDRTGALRQLERAAEIAPDRAHLWRSLARLYDEEDRHADLLRALEAELGTGPESARSHLLHARAAELLRGPLDDPGAAIEHFRAVLELDPSDARAAEFVIEALAREERHAELSAVLVQRLEHLEEREDHEEATALRLRIAALRAGPLSDLEGAIEVLEPALERPQALPIVAEPLADLHQRDGDREALIDVCRRAASALDDAGERAGWSLRLGDALREDGAMQEAVEAYRAVLVDRPDDASAESALRDLYRRLEQAEPLARLLEAQLQGLAGGEEIPVRLELAALLADALERPDPALTHLRRVLELEPGHADATERALVLARRLGRDQELLELLDAALSRSRSRSLRAERMRERATLLAGPLARPAEAVENLREAVRLAPSDPDARRALRDVLVAEGDHAGALAALESEAAMLPASARAELYEQAARLAQDHVGPAASLPWLLRLSVARPEARDVHARIALAQRASGDREGLLLALRAQLALEPPGPPRAALLREMAGLYESDLSAPGRAIGALEAARTHAPDDAGILQELDRLYRAAARHRDRASVLEARLAQEPPAESLALARELARLRREHLDEGAAAADLLYARLGGRTGLDRVDVLRELAASLRGAGRLDLAARVTEEELRSLDDDEVFAERRFELTRELARTWQGELARPDRALPHWRALVDWEGDAADALRDEAERALLDDLRAARCDVELARRLEARLDRAPEGTDAWLELARLYEERLHRPAAAARAYREVLGRDPERRDALRGLRRVCERLGRMDEVATTLETELSLPAERDPKEASALWRRLGEIAWRHLDSTTRASGAFASALEADPADLVSLRSLQTLFEGMEDWRGAVDLYESEVEVLGEREPERRQAAWLRAGELARDRTDENDRALRAYEQAARVAPLPAERRAEWAELYDRTGRTDRFAEVFAEWCDDAGSGAGPDELVRLASALESLDRHDEARVRLEQAVECDPSHGDAWDQLARLRDAAGDAAAAADALEQAAGCRFGREACERLLAAALRLEQEDTRRAVELLGRGVQEDAAHAPAQATLARVARRMGRQQVACEAGLRAIDLRSGGASLDDDDALEAALAGAAAAREETQGEAAARLYRAALEIDPRHAEAWSGLAEVRFDAQDWPAARDALEHRLELAAPDVERARLTALLARSLDQQGEDDAALERFREAAELDPSNDPAHAGLCELYERSGRLAEAVDALQTWALRAEGDAVRAERLVRAAGLELSREGREEPAEALLREACSLRPDEGNGWAMLASLVAAQGRTTDALEIATQGLAAVPSDAPERAGLHQARGAALEKRGERGEAADAYRSAVASDPTRVDAALAAARLLRAEGEWRRAAETLDGFLAEAPGGDPLRLAEAWFQLGRLRAGPLEDVAAAVAAYRHALEGDPSLSPAREALAELLVHLPESHPEAADRHRELLAADPTRRSSLRALQTIAAATGRSEAVALGCALLDALGLATPEERREGRRARLPALGDAELEPEAFAAARRVAREAAREIGDALDVGTPGGAPPEASDPAARFRAQVLTEEAALAAPALVPLRADEIGSLLTLAAQLATEVDSVAADGNLVNELSQRLGRRARRRVRKALGDVTPDALAEIDWEAWRAELRALAGARVLERDAYDLRTALVAWLPIDESERRALPEAACVNDLVGEAPEARALLRRIVAAWASRI